MADKLVSTFATFTTTGDKGLAIGYEAANVWVYITGTPTWGGGTLKMQMSGDGGTTKTDVASASWTSGSGLMSNSPFKVYGGYINFNLASGSGHSITVQVVVVPLTECFRIDSPATLTADATGAAFFLPRPVTGLALFAKGTWGSGTLKIQLSPDGGSTWVDTDLSLTASGIDVGTTFATAKLVLARAVLSGSTNPSLTWALFGY